MDTPYREGAGLATRMPGPARMLVREYHWAGNPRIVFAAVPFGLVLAFQTWLCLTADRSRWGANEWFSFEVTAFLMVASILFVAHRAQSQKGDVAIVFEDGIVHHRLGTTTEIAWDDITTLTSDARRHILRGAGGATMTFTPELEGLTELVQELRARVVKRFVPDALVAFDGGHGLAIGALRVDKEGIVGIPWREVVSVDADEALGVVRVRTREEHRAVTIEQVPNVAVVVALAEHALKRSE